MNIWFVSIFENTPLDDNQNTRYNSLVNESVARGYKVTFWASTFRHNIKQQRFDKTHTEVINESLKVIFVASKAYQKNISLSRLRSHFHLAKEMVRVFGYEELKPDLIVNAFPPVSVAKEVSDWANRNQIPYIMDVIDPWPDVFRTHIKMVPKFITDLVLNPLDKGVKMTVRNADAILGISNQYVEWAKSHTSEPKESRCYYPAVQFENMQQELKRAAEKSAMDGEQNCPFEIIYAGSLGYSYDINAILKAAEMLENRCGGEIHFTIAGDGPQKEKVKTYQALHNNLTYVGRVPKEELMELYHKADMGMTQHSKGATQSVTYKLFDLLACGLPILNSLESEMKDIIVKNKVGLHNNPGDAAKLAENILYCYNNREELHDMKKRAITLTKELGDSEKVYSEALDFFETFQTGKDGVRQIEKETTT